METRSEQRRRELSERRQRATKLMNMKWEAEKVSSEKEERRTLASSSPVLSTHGHADELEKQREERLARREERRKQREAEEREHANRMEERRRRREELKAQIGSSPSSSRRSAAAAERATSSAVPEAAVSEAPSAVCSSTSSASSVSAASATDGPEASSLTFLAATGSNRHRRSRSTAECRNEATETNTESKIDGRPRKVSSPGRPATLFLGSSMDSPSSGHASGSEMNEGGGKKQERLRGALLELEELDKANERDLLKRESFLDLQTLVSDMKISPKTRSATASASPASALINSAASAGSLAASSVAASSANHGNTKHKTSHKEKPNLGEGDAGLAHNGGGGGKKKGILQLSKLKIPSPGLNRKKGREKDAPSTSPEQQPQQLVQQPGAPAVSAKSKEEKKKAQLRNYTIAGGKGVQHELPIGVSWKDLRAILATSNIPTTERVVKSLPLPRNTRLTREELYGTQDVPSLAVLRKHLFEEGRLEIELARELLSKGKELFAECSNVLEITAPLAICGDVHGQYYDLLTLLDAAGNPKDTPFLFLGDYVDRGCFSTEVCFFLLTCKLNYPHTFHLLRGNHECRQLAEYFNFRAECKSKYDESIYTAFMEMFDALPLAAVIDTKQGKYLAVHGGLSPFIKNVVEIKNLDRFTEPPEQGAFCDLLWSDPLVDQYDLNAREHQTVTYLSNRNRGCGYLYGWKAVTDFLEANKLLSVIRAHEVQQYGYAEHWFKQDLLRPPVGESEEAEVRIPPVITVFSAPNYCDLYQNKGAYMWLHPDGKYEFKQISWATHPAYLPQFMNGLAFSFPFITEQLSKFCYTILRSVEEDEQMADDFASEDIHAERIRQKVETVRKIMILMKKLREENVSQLPAQEIIEDSKQKRMHRNLSVFERALRIDKKNEARPKSDRLYRTL